jgi:hypothetical protein
MASLMRRRAFMRALAGVAAEDVPTMVRRWSTMVPQVLVGAASIE